MEGWDAFLRISWSRTSRSFGGGLLDTRDCDIKAGNCRTFITSRNGLIFYKSSHSPTSLPRPGRPRLAMKSHVSLSFSPETAFAADPGVKSANVPSSSGCIYANLPFGPK